MAIDNTAFLLVLAYLFNYLLIYKKERLVGNLVFMGLSVTSLLATDINPAISITLLALSVIVFFYDFMTDTVKA